MKLINIDNESDVFFLPKKSIDDSMGVMVLLEQESSRKSFFYEVIEYTEFRDSFVVQVSLDETNDFFKEGDFFSLKFYTYALDEYPTPPTSINDNGVDLVYYDTAMAISSDNNGEEHSVNYNDLDVYTETDNNEIIIYGN